MNNANSGKKKVHDDVKGVVGKIEPATINANSKELGVNEQDILFEKNSPAETGNDLLLATRLLLRHHGVRKSAAAIRDAVDEPHETFSQKHAINALGNLGFKTSFGKMKLRSVNNDFFPLIAYKKTGEPVLVSTTDSEDDFVVTDPRDSADKHIVQKDQFEKDFSGYVILVKAMNSREREEVTGHWFFSAFRKSKWIYTQVLIAAIVSNILGVTTAIFTMVVYDRVIPNGAVESLYALAIGVGIALFFDFLIKSLRAKFIDVASKKADLIISKRVFDRILSLRADEQYRKTGALANTVREFEILREFFNSSTLVLLADLPFVLLFIYVISLVSGPLAYIPMIAVPVVIIVGLAIQP